MSILEAINNNISDLQIWNNAAFDNGESEESSAIKASWSPLKPLLVNRSESLDSASSKENQSPVFGKSPVPVKSPAPVKPLRPNGAIGNSQGKATKIFSKQGLAENSFPKNGTEQEFRDEKKIDTEIEKIEMEICRLSTRLEALKVEKAEQNAKKAGRPGRVVPAKFMEQKQSVKISDVVKKIEEPSQLSARTKVQRRGLSLGPSEIAAGVRRGVSLGPSEIVAGVKSRQLGKPEITPVQAIQNRRKSCFWKLHDIDEEKVKKERGKCSSVSPKSRKTISKIPPSRQAVTTVGSRKSLKKDEGVLSSIQPKKLFKDGEKSVPAKKPWKQGRVVASRYNQSSVQNSAMRKRSLPENDNDEVRKSEKKRASSVGRSRGTLPELGRDQCMESRVKKKWEIPSAPLMVPAIFHEEILVENSSPLSINKISDMLPRLRTALCTIDSPRDSGPAKRVAELIGSRSYFCSDEEIEPSVCQALSFAGGEVED
ncbi:uncharacterized protein LOC132308053 [Cornus florida]|uniref:uncharacterized protein LOC132308053 n=1 Tax=Cornus florida TaxID=4283 RepID=UPI0028A0F918|nr:uncharacterized protein LOC132308053 [Cornus florida]